MSLFGSAKEKNQRKAEKLYETGLLYYEGKDIPREVEKAVSFFKQAAEKDNADACKALGWIYLYEPEVQKNVIEAVQWYEAGLQLGDTQCAYNLAAVYCNEEGFRDLEKAYDLFTQAAGQGDANACYYRAQFLRYGNGVEKNVEEACIWYQKAHEGGVEQAAGELAIVYEEWAGALDPEAETDCKQAAEYLKNAAKWYQASSKESFAQQAEACLQEAALYEQRAAAIHEEIEEAWRAAPEPEQAYYIVVAGDYDLGGRELFEAIKRITAKRFSLVEGRRDNYRFFWFQDQGQAVEVIIYFAVEKLAAQVAEDPLRVSRLIPVVPYQTGLMEPVRLAAEAAREHGSCSILPVTVFLTAGEEEEEELCRLVEADLTSFGKGNHAEETDIRQIHLAPGHPAGLPEEFCFDILLNSSIGWWTVPVEGIPAPEESAAMC